MPPKGKPDEARERQYKAKWESLKKRGINPPANAAEAKQRLKDAHGY